MKGKLVLTALFVLLLASMATAYTYNTPYISPSMPRTDATVRQGGYFGSMAPYFANLRGGVVREPVPPQNYNLRYQFSRQYYPQEPYYGYQSPRARYDRGYGYRVGGYNYRGYSGYRGYGSPGVNQPI
jgi:hypothetical protein